MRYRPAPSGRPRREELEGGIPYQQGENPYLKHQLNTEHKIFLGKSWELKVMVKTRFKILPKNSTHQARVTLNPAYGQRNQGGCC